MTPIAFGQGTPPETHDHEPGGYHACCIYSSDQERRLRLTQYLAEGIRAGDKVVCATYDSTIENLLADLSSAGLDPTTLLKSRQLVIVSSLEAYTEGGRFSVDLALERIEEQIIRAKDEGYPGVRTTGDLMWMEGLPETRDSFLEYESRVNRIIAEHGSSALCLYDRSRFSAADLLHCLSVHPVAWVGDDEVANPHFHLPEEIRDHDPIADELDRRRRAWEERARAARTARLLERTLETLDTAVLAVDPDTRTILDGNQAAERIFGVPRDGLVGAEARDFFPTEALWLDFENACVEVLQKGATYEHDGEMRRADDSTFPARHVVTLLDTHSGAGDIIVSTIRDLSRESELEAQLRQSQKMEAVGRLAGGVAHDFNNLLTLVRGHAELALEDPKGAPGDLEGILDAVERAATLTRQLLLFSRDRTGEPGVVELGEVVRELLPLLRRLVPERVGFEVEIAPERYLMMGDADGLERTLMNLVLNALDAIEGTGQIRIMVDRTEHPAFGPRRQRDDNGETPGPWCRLVVEDTGTGMSPGVRERIFDPFYTTKAEGQGTGLGLSTVFSLVSKVGGRVGVQSEVGRGTTFELLFPEVREAIPGAAPAPERITDSGAPTAVREAQEGGGILVIEDDENLAHVIRKVLARAGWTVHEAHSAEHARALVAGVGAEDGVGEIDVILCDVVLPGTQGPELVEELRERLPRAPVVFMSGYTGEELRGRIPDDAAGFLCKPFSPVELVAAVRGAGGARVDG